MAESEIADDTIEGVEEIARFLGKKARQVYWLCETKQIPAFKLGGKWHLRRSTYRTFVARRAAEAGVA